MTISKTFNLLILIICLNTALAQNSETVVKINEIVSVPVQSGEVAGVSVTVLNKGNVLYDNTHGLSDVDGKIPLKNTDQFLIGSVTKIFTATAIYKLFEDGEIDFNLQLSHYLPEIKIRQNDPTIRQLLQHTSGLPEYTLHMNSESESIRDKVLSSLQNTPSFFSAGSQTAYSNSGFYLLGLIIEKISGMSYSDFVYSKLIEPHDFSHISYYQPNNHLERVKGYRLENNNFVIANQHEPDYPYAAGNISSNSSDLAKWFYLLNTGKVLHPSTLEEMKKITTLECGHSAWYASGLFINVDPSGRSVIRHSGDINGFRSDLAYYPDYDLTISVLINTQSAVRPENITVQIADEITKLKRTKWLTPKKDTEAFTGIYGGYKEGKECLMEVFIQNDTLKIVKAGEQPQNLYIIDKNKFTTGPNKWEEVPEYEFITQGDVNKLHYTGISTHCVLTNKFPPEIKYWSVGRSKTSKVKVDGKDIRIKTKSPFPKRFPKQPMVIMESGYGSSLGYWGDFFNRTSDFIPVLAYDRAGLGESEWIDQIPTNEFKVDRLKKLLEIIHAEPPYVLVGHSYGCDLVRLFAERYPDLATGLVLLDPVSENPSEVLEAFEAIGEGRKQYEELISFIFKDSENPWSIAHKGLEKPLWDKALPLKRAKPDHLPIKILYAGRKPTESMASQLPFDVYSHQKELEQIILKRISKWIYNVPEGEMVIIPSSGHMVFNDEREISIKAIKDIIYPSIHRSILHKLDKNGIDEAINDFYYRKAYYPIETYNEQLLNQLGYRLLRNEKYEQAIAIFKLNTKEYPNEANPYDSLGDAYRNAGKLMEAVTSYEKAALIAEKNKDPRAQNYKKRFEYYKDKL